MSANSAKQLRFEVQPREVDECWKEFPKRNPELQGWFHDSFLSLSFHSILKGYHDFVLILNSYSNQIFSICAISFATVCAGNSPLSRRRKWWNKCRNRLMLKMVKPPNFPLEFRFLCLTPRRTVWIGGFQKSGEGVSEVECWSVNQPCAPGS